MSIYSKDPLKMLRQVFQETASLKTLAKSLALTK